MCPILGAVYDGKRKVEQTSHGKKESSSRFGTLRSANRVNPDNGTLRLPSSVYIAFTNVNLDERLISCKATRRLEAHRYMHIARDSHVVSGSSVAERPAIPARGLFAKDCAPLSAWKALSLVHILMAACHLPLLGT